MATNDFIGFASNGSANIMSQANYAAAMEQGNGVQPGMASSALANKIWRQGANMASAIGAFIASRGHNALDNGDINTLKKSFELALWQEGTWTPELKGFITPGTYTYKIQTGEYLKIGDLIYITGELEIGDYTVHPVGRAHITGLPYRVNGQMTLLNLRGTVGLSGCFNKCVRAVTTNGYTSIFIQGIDQSTNVITDLIFSATSQVNANYLSLEAPSEGRTTGYLRFSGIYRAGGSV